MFKNILVPVDLTDKTTQAVETAKNLLAEGGSVVLLHVIEQLETEMDEEDRFYRKLEEEAQAKMRKHVERLIGDGISAEVSIRIGKRARAIVQFSRDHKFDLMILYSHRLDPTDLMRSLLTISHQVAIAAECPVLLLR